MNRGDAVLAALASARAEPLVDTDRHQRTLHSGRCGQCGGATRYVETTFAYRLHPGACTTAWDEVYEAAGVTRGPWLPYALTPLSRQEPPGQAREVLDGFLAALDES